MLELKVEDIRLRGCGFTLYVAAKENGVEPKYVDDLLTVIYVKLGACSEDCNKSLQVRRQNPNILDVISVSDIKAVWCKTDNLIDYLLTNELVTRLSGEELKLTEKTVNILKRAAEIQNELDEEGFSHCPCHPCC